MQVGGGPVDVVGLYTLALIMNICGFLWAAGIAMRLRTIQAGPLMQMPVFLLLFLAPVYVPLALLGGTLHAFARFNPRHLRARGRAAASSPATRRTSRSGSALPLAARGRLLGVGAPRACARPRPPGRAVATRAARLGCPR